MDVKCYARKIKTKQNSHVKLEIEKNEPKNVWKTHKSRGHNSSTKVQWHCDKLQLIPDLDMMVNISVSYNF